ncbi:MAG: hypothetical protein IK002_06270 [Treponema sp.]|nr:hypothetical protein [Treponema sp.]MBR5933578.1 hypothetical protein [Treponema sp.]
MKNKTFVIIASILFSIGMIITISLLAYTYKLKDKASLTGVISTERVK